MRWPLLLRLAALALTVPPAAAAADTPKTVCTITVNSADEKQAFRRHLPSRQYRFVELVERGRPDWLSSACSAAVACDVLVISGHYDGSKEFFSDRLDAREYLPVAELERVACSESCPALFARLKEVHLYGCNTLNPQPQSGASAEWVRGLVREGHAPPEAERQLQALDPLYGQSSRDRMRQLFKGVPVIYGFSAAAPLGPIAADTLERYFRGGGAREIGQGRPSSRLLANFAPFSMSVAAGLSERDAQTGARHDMCHFADDRLSQADRLAFVHELLQRPMTEVRVYLDRIQALLGALDDTERQAPGPARVLAAIVADAAAKARFLDFARHAERPALRARMVMLAQQLGWLTEEQRWQELALLLAELLARRSVGLSEVDLACSLNQAHDLDGAFNRRVSSGSPADDVAHAAVRACLGSSEGHLRTLQGLTSADAADARIAQAYLRHRPITDGAELRSVAAAIAGMPPSPAQVHALEALGRHYLSDGEILTQLTGLFARTSSWSVQAAVAGILMRADLRSIARAPLLRTLLAERRPAPPGDNMIDALIRRLQAG